MGTLNFTLGSYGKYGGNAGTGHVVGTTYRTSAAHTTSTSAGNIQVSASDVTAQAGELFVAVPSEDMWLAFGGGTAAVGTGHFAASGLPFVREVSEPGTISAIDVS